MDDEPSVADLVRAAIEGDGTAWDALVARYTPLVVSIVRGSRLQDHDVRDIIPTVWLRLVEHLGDLREPAALPGWIRTTTRNECLRVLAARGRVDPVDPQEGGSLADADAGHAVDDELLGAERRQALRDGLVELPSGRRDLLLLLLADPPLAYEEIGARLGIPVGSIGPTRARALDQLRRTRVLRGLGPDPVRGA